MARNKKAPAVKSNLRNLPDMKQRAIDRIGNIVTMIEITNGTDIKAYELEPEYQEIGGGGGELNNPLLTISVDASATSGDVGAIPLLVNTDGTLQSKTANVTGGTSVIYEDIIVLEYDMGGDSAFVWDGSKAYPSILGATQTLTISDEVNCSVTLDKGNGNFYAMITDPTHPASFTLTVS